MAGTATRLRLRLFLEGVEAPVIAAVVQSTPNAPGVASIQVPPLPEGTRLLPRTLVHLYFLDTYEAQSAASLTNKAQTALTERGGSPTAYEQQAQRAAESQGNGDNTTDSGAPPYLNEHYKLLFVGEVVGFSWSKSPTTRSLVLKCLDLSNYWDYAYQWNNTDLFGPGMKALFAGGSTNLFTDLLMDEGSIILQILRQPSVQYPNLKGLLGGIVHLLEAIGGSYYSQKKFAGENIFFSLAELRLHITQMITAYEKDPTAARLINADGYDGLFGRTLGGLGSQVSIRQAIQALMSMIFHETYAIPTPLYVPGTSGDVGGAGRRRLRGDAQYGYIVEQAEMLAQSVSNLRDAFGSEKQDDRTLARATQSNVLGRLQDLIFLASNTLNRIRGSELAAVRGFFASALTSLRKVRGLASRWLPGSGEKLQASIYAELDSAIAQLRRVASYEVVTRQKGWTPARLNQQIFRPDVWFSAPPRCNVLFPEQYTQLSYERSFLQEPTRLLLKTNDEFFGEDELFDQFYFAPKGITLKHERRTLQAMLSNDLLDHELFTGVLPVFEKMGELNIFAARSGTVNGRMPKIGLAQRSTNFLYYKYRFAARQMQVSGRFNPYVAPGFPGLIIDRYLDADALLRRQQLINSYGGVTPDAEKLLGTHFLANFTEVTHTVDQHQGRTDINCSYARQPEESVEFLGAIEYAQNVGERFGTNVLEATDIAALMPPKVRALGPRYGTVARVTEVTDVYRAHDVATGRKLPLYGGPRRAGTAAPRMEVAVGVTAPASAYGPDVAALIGSSTESVLFRAYRVEEEVPRYRQTTEDLPAEEYIRPGWYGDCWHPAQIGQVYQHFFQTGAITDEQQVVNGAGAPTEAATDALAAATQGLEGDDPGAARSALYTLDKSSSIQAAVAFLVETYSYVKQAGMDVEQFVQGYTWRPVATMVDLFGSSDLTLSQDGLEVLQGIEGFHSRAFGPYSDLFGLVAPDIETVLGIKRGSTVARKGDTRRRKQDAVKEYVAALQFARAVLG